MITESFDSKTKPIPSLEDFYGEQKHIITKCLIIFSKEIHGYILSNFDCEIIGKIHACNGTTNIYKFVYDGEELGFYLTPIGSALASQYCIECNWVVGATKFIMFGSAGSLDRDKTGGKAVIPTEAYRDEGMSYHYAPPKDYILIKNHGKVKSVFEELKIPCVSGRVWTTDAFLMETVGLTEKRKEEGCIAVEMELAGVQSVCDYYGLELYDFLITGDVLSAEEYRPEGLREANHSLDKLFFALEIAKRI